MTASSPFGSSDGNVTASGSHWTVLMQPSFVDQAFEAAHLITRPPAGPSSKQIAAAASAPPSEFSQNIRSKATTLVEQQEHQRKQLLNTDDNDDDDDDDTKEVTREQEPDTEAVKEAKRRVVEEIWTKLVPGCFARSDDRELEATVNLLMSLWLPLFQDRSEFKSMLNVLIEAVSKSEGKIACYGRCTSLTSIFNSVPTTAKDSTLLQLSILLRIASLASSSTSDLAIVTPALLRLPSYLSTWGITNSAAATNAVSQVASTFERDGQAEHAYSLCTAYLQLPGATGPNIAAQAVRLALSLPDCYDWDTLLLLSPVKEYLASSAGSGLQATVAALKSGHVADVQKSLKNAGDKLNSETKESVERKAKLLALADLCGSRVGGDVRYEEVKECLQLSTSIGDDDGMEVEEWIINAIKAKLVTARLHQPSHVVHVVSATPRVFGKAEWQTLLDRLQAWSSSVDSIVSVVAKSLPAGSRSEGEDAEGVHRGPVSAVVAS